VNPTPEQRAAVESPSRYLIVSASAGSGKTWVLVERYLRHVLSEGIPPSAIWTATFTHKAASEMRSRILAGLRRAGRHDFALQAETGPIGTIDSLGEAILRANSVDAGLDPEYELVGSSTLAHLADAAAKRALEQSSQAGLDGDAGDELEEALAGKRGRKPRAHGELLALITRFLEQMRNGRLSVDELESELSTASKVEQAWRRAAAELCGEDVGLDDPQFWRALSDRFEPKTRPKWLGGRFEGGLAEAAHTARMVRLGCRAWRYLEQRMLARAQLDFTLQQRLVVRLLEESALVQRRLETTMAVVLVDEGQDLNPLQYRLLEALRGIVSRREVGYALVVGDPKQSVYAFRQATPEQFRKLARGEVGGWEGLSLSRNHRSTPQIQRFVDAWAREKFEAYLPMTTELGGFEGVDVRRAPANPAELAVSAVEELIRDGHNPSSIAVLMEAWTHARGLASELAKRGISSQSSARSRFHTHMTVRDLALTMRALSDPLNDYAYLCTLRSPMAGLSLDAVIRVAWAHTRCKDRPALSTFEWEPPGADDRERLTAFREWFEPLREEAGRWPAWRVLSAILSNSGYLERIARRPGRREAVANARRLLSIAAEEPTLSAGEFALRVQRIQELEHRETEVNAEPAEDAVVISTIHSAKGLEFDAVVLAGLPEKGHKESALEIDLLRTWLATDHARSGHPFVKLLRQHLTAEGARERERLLYVALTRAKKRLIVIHEAGNTGTELQAILKAAPRAPLGSPGSIGNL
jgi:ATP-dependent exoDNAse (exonuclease V) beta subunit